MRFRICDFGFNAHISNQRPAVTGHRSVKEMFATIYLPNFYLQAAMRHHPKLRAQAVALIDTAESKVSIIQLNELAEKAGVAKRMTPSQPLARCLPVVIRTPERAQENMIHEILFQHTCMLSPFVLP